MHYIYFLKSLKNGKYYVGRTEKSPETRLAEHNLGSNSWTKHNSPFKLIYFEKYYCSMDCIARKSFIKLVSVEKLKKILLKKF